MKSISMSSRGHRDDHMATAAAAEDVKAAITSGSASTSTITTLQTLLCEVPPRPTSAKTGPASASTAQRGTATRAPVQSVRCPQAARGRKQPDVQVLEDVRTTLPLKARYALATDIVNTTLKVLGDAAKSGPKHRRRRSSLQEHVTPQRNSSKALQLRSANATPAPSPAGKNPRAQRRPSQSSVTSKLAGPSHLECVAECARLGFACLRSTDVGELGLRQLPSWQLENGMLSLCGKLLNLGFRSLAAKQLRAVKHSLETTARTTPDCRPDNATSSKPAQDAPHWTLLLLHQDVHASPSALPTVISYQLHVMQLLVLISDGSNIDKAVDFLCTGKLESPSGAILRHLENGADPNKAGKQLEALSRSMLQLCPSVSATADEQAKDRSLYASPLSVFRLQVASLCLQQQSRKLMKRADDIEKDIVEPFSRCLSTLLRRTSSRSDAPKLLEACTASYQALDIQTEDTTGCTSAYFTILITLSRIAQMAGLQDQAKQYAEMALKQCHKLEKSHARYIAALSRRACALAASGEPSKPKSAEWDLDAVAETLQKNLSGTSSDYETLLLELSQLVRLPLHDCTELETHKRVLCAAAAFASSYVRVCSAKNAAISQEIVHRALSGCGSSQDMTSWVTRDTASVMIKSGALRRLADKAASSSLETVCSSSGTAIACGRIVKILVTKAVTAGSEKSASYIVDDDDLETAERGVLLEWQLKCSVDFAHKPKYRQALSKLMQELLWRLSKTYDAVVYPLRRARLSVFVLRVQEEYPELLPPHSTAAFGTSTLECLVDLAKDEGLKGYLPDLQATLNLSRAFHDGCPSFRQIRPCLDVWNTLLETAESSADIRAVIDSPVVLIAQLTSLEEYFGMLGDDVSRLTVSTALHRYTKLSGTVIEHCNSGIKVARANMALGYGETARDALRTPTEQLQNDGNALAIELIDCHLAKAECTLLLDEVNECRDALMAAHQARQKIPPHAVRSVHSQRYKIIHGRAWLLQSRFLMATGLPRDALRAAKHASKVLNSIWAGLERNDQSAASQVTEHGPEPKDPPVDALTAKVSKLNLKPAGQGPSSKKTELRGATFWPVVRLLCQSSLHLADMYTHHGIYNEANHASEQALKIADAVGARGLLSDIRAHRGLFLAYAGRFEDSELCVEQDDPSEEESPSFSSIERSKAKALAGAQRGEPNVAVAHLKEAAEVIKTLLSRYDRPTVTNGQLHVEDGPSGAKSGTTRPVVSASRVRAPSRTTTNKPTKARTATTKSMGSSTAVSKATGRGDKVVATAYVLQKVQAELAFYEAAIDIKYGGKSSKDLHELQEAYAGLCRGRQWRSLEQDVLLSKNIKALEADFSLSVLTESVLSYPALQLIVSIEVSTTSPAAMKPPAKHSKSTAGIKKMVHKAPTSGDLLPSLTKSVLDGDSDGVTSTTEAHKRHDLLSAACMITSATSTSSSRNNTDLMQALSSIDRGRIHASQSMMTVACLERDSHRICNSLAWPDEQVSISPRPAASASFRSEYVDVLPRSWTAVSMCLSESCEELYIARYRGSQTPLVLRIPFSRQKSDEAEEERFLYGDGKTELEEIIRLSNFTCHSSLDVSAKGAKTNWWAEREALDRRMHELLINMENLWLGGFRGIFSQHRRDQDQLDRFRRAFEAMLDRHLPSRRGSNRATNKLVLDDQILELFIGLGSDQDGELELDELLGELLFFVVDILQFNGERNAYDEVDIDRMVVDVLDAIRSYHDSIEEKDEEAHLILVLDRRLQAFPWENLPCLEHVSVSRMDSMHSLRERIMAMRQQVQASKATKEDRYLVTRSSGTYILNPGGDLEYTESTLVPELSQLASAEAADWKSIVRQAPSEVDFKAALSSSSTLLYFGHGAGSQYIRPRAIRRLDKCSEVVWLMGCSSGAVTEYGKLEPFAVPLMYMLAGQSHESPEDESTQVTGKCMSVLATLWDVTDKDIDRFSLAVGEDWGLWKAQQTSTKPPAKTPRKKEKVIAPSTPEKTCKTPKTPKVKKTPVPPKTPVRSGGASRERGQKKMSLVEAVARSREACYLRYLNGAAPVVYGIPVYLGD